MNVCFLRGGIAKSSIIGLGLLLAVGLAPARPQQRAQVPPKNIFEDDRIAVRVPTGWSVHPATETVTGDRTYEQPIGAVLAKGRFRLYLLTHHGQASGIVGGRFAEIVQYVSPWINISDSPWLPCPSETREVETAVSDKLSRRDLYFDTTHASKKALADCGDPKSKGVLWYGSYFIDPCPAKDCGGGFFLNHQALAGKPSQDGSTISEEQMTYALTYDTKMPNKLPARSNRAL
ncbi:MAG: hypothetical protein WBX38_10870 [Candidatus Sulfotelmatobacter sp.]